MFTVALLYYLLWWFEFSDVCLAQKVSQNERDDLRCGKAYRGTDASFDPGGALHPPDPSQTFTQLKLDIRVFPRKTFYTPSDQTASFIIDTPVSFISGMPYVNSTFDPENSPNQRVPFNELKLFVRSDRNGVILVNWVRVPVNATGVEVEFSLEGMEANTGRGWAYGRSRIVARESEQWHGFTGEWEWIRRLAGSGSEQLTANLKVLRQQGYNTIQITPPPSVDPSDSITLADFLRICSELDLFVMYNLQEIYLNQSSVAAHLSQLQNHPSLLLYHSANAPDYYTEAPSDSLSAYNFIQSIDRYHPVSLSLHCDNYLFGEYAAGTDIVREDTSPLKVNTSWSAMYGTPCNITYGDCGCDNCHANDPNYPGYVENPFLDIVDRVERLSMYQRWLVARRRIAPGEDRKPVWSMPQTLPTNGTLDERLGSAKEEFVTELLRINHGVKGIVSQTQPVDPDMINPKALIVKFITAPSITRFLVRARRVPLQAYGADGVLDAAMWVLEESVLVSIVFLGAENATRSVGVEVPEGVILSKVKTWWGSQAWSIVEGGIGLRKYGLSALEIAVLQGTRG